MLHGRHAAKVLVPDGLPAVGGAVVSIAGLGRTTTNAAGSFTLGGLHVSARSTYALTVVKKGFGRWQESGIRLVPGVRAHIYVELHTAATTFAVPKPVRQSYNGPARTGSARTSPARKAVQQATGGCERNSSGWTSQTQQPPTIRVYMTGVHGPTDAGTVVRYSFTFYEEHVLPNEWFPSWDEAALEAGAVAVRDYAWYFVVNGSKGTTFGSPDPCSFDVDDSTNYQDFDPFAPTYSSTNTAVTATAPYLYRRGSAIPETAYNSGFQGEACGGETVPGSLSQWGTQSCAMNGDSWQKILSIYYGFTLSLPGSDAPAAVVYNPASGNLEVYATGTDASLEERYWNSAHGWSGWQHLGGAITGSPSAVYNTASGNLEVYATATNGSLQEIYWNRSTGWSRWQNLGGAITGSPSAVYDPASGNLEVYATGTNGALQ
jgi:Stage II sporulation protein